MILIVDNYDSFTYNLKQACEGYGYGCEVLRNDAVGLMDIVRMKPEKIILSPGPGNPDSAGITLSVIRELSGRVPILGVCLGHQAIGQAFGGRVMRAPRPRHGKVSRISHLATGIFEGLPSPLRVARYHSLLVERSTLPLCLEVSAETDDGLIMGFRHRDFEVHGVQFHPESIATEHGQEMIGNFLKFGASSRA